jgi:glutathione S-transferase
MIKLYWSPRSRSFSAIWLMEESELPYERVLTDISTGAQKAPEYLAVNPMGKVPALKHGDTVITEAAAICCYLADAFPQAGLSVPIGDPRRGTYLKWLFFGPSCVEPAVTDKAFKRAEAPPRGTLGYGDYDTVMSVLADGVRAGPYLLGEHFTAADVVIGSGLRWGMAFKLIPERPEFVAYTARLAARPALKRAQAKDAELTAAPAH